MTIATNMRSRKVTANNAGKLVSLLVGKLYKHPLWSTIREITANAIDIHTTSNTDAPIEIIVTAEYIMIRDNGPGMDAATFDGVYLDVGSSTKENSQIDTGCMGIGSKSPHAVHKEFTVVNHHNGVATETLLLSEGMSDIEAIDISTSKTDRTGLDVIIPFAKGGYTATEALSWAMVMKSWSRFVDINVDNQSTGHLGHVTELSTYSVLGDNYYATELSGTVCYKTCEIPDNMILVPEFFMKDSKYQERTMLARCGAIIYPVALRDPAYEVTFTKTSTRKDVYTLPNKSSTTLIVDIPKKNLPIVPSREELQMTPEFKELYLKKAVTTSDRVRVKLDKISNKKLTALAKENFYLYQVMLKQSCTGKKFDMNLFRMHNESRRVWRDHDHKDIWGDHWRYAFTSDISDLSLNASQHSVKEKLRIGLITTAKNSRSAFNDIAKKRGEFLVTNYDMMAAKVDVVLTSTFATHRNIDEAKKWLTIILGDKMDCVELFLIETADMAKAGTVYDKLNVPSIGEYYRDAVFEGDPAKAMQEAQKWINAHKVYLADTSHSALHSKSDIIHQLVEIMHGGRYRSVHHFVDTSKKHVAVIGNDTHAAMLAFAKKHSGTFDFSKCIPVKNITHAGIEKMDNEDWINAKKELYTHIVHNAFHNKAAKINKSFSKISEKAIHEFPEASVEIWYHGNGSYELRQEAIEVLGLTEEVRTVERLECHPMVTLLDSISNGYYNESGIADALVELYTENRELFDSKFAEHNIKI